MMHEREEAGSHLALDAHPAALCSAAFPLCAGSRRLQVGSSLGAKQQGFLWRALMRSARGRAIERRFYSTYNQTVFDFLDKAGASPLPSSDPSSKCVCAWF